MNDNNTPLNFLVADDHRIITQSMSFIIKGLYKNCEVEKVNTLGEILKALKKTNFSVLILDVSFPEGNTLQLVATIRNLYPHLKILMFSGHDEELYVLRYLNAGANGFISKLSTEEEIQTAIISLVDTGKYLSAVAKDLIADTFMDKKSRNTIDKLSDRELEIANLLVEGLGNTQISEKLNLQKSTVSTYKNRIFEKLNISNITELIHSFQSQKNI